jgi:hypothetical protein
MTGGNVLRVMLLRPAEQRAELEIAIARHTGIGRAAAQVILRERLYHRFGKLGA